VSDHPQRSQSPQDDLGAARTHAILGAAIEVHRTLGTGFLERVYQLAMEHELRRRGILHQPEPAVPVWYKGEKLDCTYRPDFICFDSVVVELKVLPALTGVETSQVLNSLRATGHELALLLNFGTPVLEKRRFVMAQPGGATVVSASSADGFGT